eukprot:PhF_6_TR13926/c1_g1_i2/m.22392
MGLMKSSGDDSYSLTGIAYQELRSPDFVLCGLFSFLTHARARWNLLTLPHVIRYSDGAPLPSFIEENMLARPFRNGINAELATFTFARNVAQTAVDVLMGIDMNFTVHDTFVFADSPCGSGGYGLTIAEYFPNSQVRLYAFEKSIVGAKANINTDTIARSTKKRIEFVSGNVMEIERSDHDVVFVSQSYHTWPTLDSMEHATRTFYKMLVPGGWLVVHDYFRIGNTPKYGVGETMPWILALLGQLNQNGVVDPEPLR